MTAQGSEPIPNLSCKVLDITIEKHWDMLNDGLAEATKNGLAAFEGVIMRELLPTSSDHLADERSTLCIVARRGRRKVFSAICLRRLTAVDNC